MVMEECSSPLLSRHLTGKQITAKNSTEKPVTNITDHPESRLARIQFQPFRANRTRPQFLHGSGP